MCRPSGRDPVMAARRAAAVRPDPAADIVRWGSRFATRGGEKRKGALVRTILVTPGAYGVHRHVGEIVHPLIPLAIGSGGKGGGEVRLKVWLSLLLRVNPQEMWMDLDEVSPLILAAVCGLDDPRGKGAGRVRDAYRWLHENNFIEIEGGRLKRSGRVRVVPEFAQFLPEKWRDAQRSSPAGSAEVPPCAEFPKYHDTYVRMPLMLWKHGWMGYLRASELMVLLFVCKLSENGRHPVVTVEAKRRLETYGLSDAMWRQGVRGLEMRGIIKYVDRDRHETDPLSFERWDYRMEIRLNGENIDEALSVPLDHDRNVEISAELTRKPSGRNG